MASYYFLMASLPMLRAEGEIPIDYPTFVTYCKGNVDESQAQALENLTVLSDQGPFLKEWSSFYKKLYDEMIYQRSVKLGRTCTPPSERDSETIQVVSSAVNNPNPLSAEQTLLRLEFDRLDELVGYHNFDERALFGYAMKLLLLERQRSFDRETGTKEFQNLLDGLREQVFSI